MGASPEIGTRSAPRGWFSWQETGPGAGAGAGDRRWVQLHLWQPHRCTAGGRRQRLAGAGQQRLKPPLQFVADFIGGEVGTDLFDPVGEEIDALRLAQQS